MSEEHDDYLWDRSGPPDPEVQRLEARLGLLRADLPPELRVDAPARSRRPLAWALAIAAGVALVASPWLVPREPEAPPVAEVAPPVDEVTTPIAAADPAPRLAVGQTYETAAGERLDLDLPKLGHVEIEPSSRVRVLDLEPTLHRLALDRGTIHARIFAPPRVFVIDTPAAQAIDLGCAYTLDVDDRGGGLLRVDSGFVELEGHGRHVTVPAGAMAEMRPDRGPGTPFRGTAPERLRAALSRVDFGESGSDATAALSEVLALAERDDALSLLALLRRLGEEQRARIADRLAAWVALPPAVSPAGILAGDARAIDRWEAAFGLDLAPD